MRLSNTIFEVQPLDHTAPRATIRRGYPVAPYAVMILLIAVMVLPFLWMFSTSLKAQEYILQTPPQLIPNPATLESYTQLADRIDLPRTFFNSLFVAIVGTIGQILI